MLLEPPLVLLKAPVVGRPLVAMAPRVRPLVVVVVVPDIAPVPPVVALASPLLQAIEVLNRIVVWSSPRTVSALARHIINAFARRCA